MAALKNFLAFESLFLKSVDRWQHYRICLHKYIDSSDMYSFDNMIAADLIQVLRYYIDQCIPQDERIYCTEESYQLQ